MKQPRVQIHEVPFQPAARNLLGFLLTSEEPVRARKARESLGLSIGQMGLAMRALERYGLAQRRNLAEEGLEGAAKLQHLYLEATELGRENIALTRVPEPPAMPRPTAPVPPQ